MNSTKKIILWCGIAFAVGLIISAIITHRSLSGKEEDATDQQENLADGYQHLTQEADDKIMERLLKEVKAENIREYLRCVLINKS